MNPSAPIEHDIVFVGGGHSHALVLRQWAMNPLPGVRLTLVSRDVLTPYSGMLPGYIAGHYSFEDIHIDLLRLCAWGGVRFIKAEMIGIDLSAKTLQLTGRPDISYDILSLDTGSTPTLEIPGAKEFATPVKPVHSFLERWDSLKNREPKHLGVVGAGAGGYELIMAMAHRKVHPSVTLHWFLRGDRPMSDRPEKVGAHALDRAIEVGVQVHTDFDVKEVSDGVVQAVDGRKQTFDDLLWCTAASSPDWPTKAGLATDSRGFIATRGTLQSTSHPEVFATGDIGTQVSTPSAKAGVFAVRQAPVLFHNLRALVLKRGLKNYVPQADFLSLVSTGDKYAIGSRSGVTFKGAWVWRLKDHIDQTFMNKFLNLPPIKMKPAKASDEGGMRCNGCGAKVPAKVLSEVLDELPNTPNKHVLVHSGIEEGEDSALVSWSSGQLVQSVDQVRALMDDPYVFGRIAAQHALSDVYTLNARAHSAQVLLTLPYANPKVVRRELLQVMLGVSKSLAEASCALIGGHTAEGSELQVGLVVNAEPEKDALAVQSSPARADTSWSLVLTQPVGIGVLFAGLMHAKARGVDVDAALPYMLQSNEAAASICREFGMGYCTDVTGFGLMGHLQRVAQREGLACTVQVSDVPVLRGVAELARQGVESSLSRANQAILENVNECELLGEVDRIILCDPQTAGGLLAFIPSNQVVNCIDSLHLGGFESAAVIGLARNACDDPDLSGRISLG